jgi:hypothetical protein
MTLSLAACASTASPAGPPVPASGTYPSAGGESIPAGPWVFTLRQPDGAEVAIRMTVERFGTGGWAAHSRRGAAAEFVGRRRAIAGRLLGRMPPHGALVNIMDGTARAVGDSVEVRGRFESGLLGSYVLVAGLVDGRLRGGLRRDSLAAPSWSVDAAPHAAPGPLRDYRALAGRIEDGFRGRIYDPALVERREFRSFFREVHRRMARAEDDGDAMAAFYAVRPRLDISHIELFRHPVMAASPLDSLLTASGSEQRVFLSFPAPGVALLRITRWADVTQAVGRAFERIDSAGSHTLVLDIRWNPGGDVTSMAPASHLLPDSTMVGVFLGRRWYAARSSPPSPAELRALPVISDGTSLTLINHVLERGAVAGMVPPAEPQFPGDVYVLINGRSGSSSEPLAYLLGSTGRATLVGEKTAGAMLSGPPRPAGDGWVLIVPEADYFAADGTRLEGTGVSPHVPVPSDRALNAVADRLARHAPYAAALLDGAGHVEGSRWSLAAESYGAAQRLEPDSLAPALGLGRAQSELGRWDAAFQAFDGVLARRPGHASALYQVGRLAALSGQRLADGEAALRAYLAHTPEPGQPSHAAARWRLGMILEADRREVEALAEYRAAVELEPHVSAYADAVRRLDHRSR